jgi:hypothetical protein
MRCVGQVMMLMVLVGTMPAIAQETLEDSGRRLCRVTTMRNGASLAAWARRQGRARLSLSPIQFRLAPGV